MITKEQLVAIGVENLADIILSLYESNDDIKKQLNIMVAGSNEDPKKIISLIKKELNSLKKSTKFIDYYGCNQLAERLDQLRLYIIKDLMPKSPTEAMELMLDFLNLHENTINRVDDSNGSVSYSFVAACSDLGKIYEEVPKSIEEIVELVFTRFMSDEYGVYDQLIQNFKNALKGEGLSLLKTKIQGAFNEKTVNKVQQGLKSIADCQNDVEAYINACLLTTDKLSAYEHLEVARRFIKQWKGKEALQWINEIDLTQNPNRNNDYHQLKIQAFELSGEYDKAQQERLTWFEESLYPDVYGQILSHAKPEFKESFKLKAIEQAFNFKYTSTALEFLIQAQEFEEAIKFTYLKLDQINGEQYHTLRPAADIFRKIDPLAATLLYRKMLQSIVDRAKSKYYNYAAKDLITCKNLSSEITNWGIYDDHDKYLQVLQVTHKRKVGFWREYEIALQKQIAKESKQSAKKKREL